jgi:hypothetical protein
MIADKHYRSAAALAVITGSVTVYLALQRALEHVFIYW